jgi:hypothetical protein
MASKRSILWVFVPLGIAYLYFSPYFRQINNPNENVRVYLVRALVDRGSLVIDPEVREWGYVNDRSVYKSRNYSAKAPGTSFSGVPGYWLQKRIFKALHWELTKARITYVARVTGVVIPTLLFLLFFGRFLERQGAAPHLRDVSMVALGLGTPLFAYGTVFVAHAQVVVCAFGAFMLTRTAADLDREGLAPRHAVAWRLVAAGLLAGWATLTEYQVVLVSAVLLAHAALALRHRRRTLWFCAGALPVAVLLLGYNYLCFDGIWEFSYSHLENAEFSHNAATGMFGFTDMKLGALVDILFSPGNGMIFFSPVLALGTVGCVMALGRRRQRVDGAIALLACAGILAYLAGNVAWRAGWSVGARYATVCVPFLLYGVVLLVVPVQGQHAGWVLSAVAAGLTIAAVGVSGVAVVYPHYPQEFRNPSFDLGWALVKDGYLPYSIGWKLGLYRHKALIPLLPFLGVALYLVLAGPGTWRRDWRWRALHVLGAVVVGAGMLFAATRASTADRATRVATNVRLKWEPRDGLPPPPPPLKPVARPGPPKPARPPEIRPDRLRPPALAPAPRSPRLAPSLRAPQVPAHAPLRWPDRPADSPLPLRRVAPGAAPTAAAPAHALPPGAMRRTLKGPLPPPGAIRARGPVAAPAPRPPR